MLTNTPAARLCAALLLIASYLTLSPSAVALAQETGQIAGVVVDAESGETLVGANAVIQDTTLAGGRTLGATTDLDGRFEIEGLEPGTYRVRLSYVGFQAKVVEGVEVSAGETTDLEVSLAPETAELEEVVVQAAAARDSEAGLLRARQKATAVSDAISAEAMSQAGSGNAADAMEKVTGASVVDGKYVYVRGLGERYASTQLNGVDLPSSDPDRKAVQFDLFATDLLDNIVTLKTFTPDRPGNFSGGLVDINTKSFPEDFQLEFSASTALNTQTHFSDNFLSDPGVGRDWLGFDSGARNLPEALRDPGVRIPNVVEARSNEALAQELDALSKAFDGAMAPVRSSAPVNQSYALSAGNESPLFGQPLGYVVSLSYDRTSSFYEGGATGRYAYSGGASRLVPVINFNDAKGTAETNLGGMANLTYRFHPRHEIGVNALYSRSSTMSARLQEGLWPEQYDDTRLVNRTLAYTERDVSSLQLRGEHHLEGLLGMRAAWSASTAHTRQEEPDMRFFAHLERTFGEDTVLVTRGSSLQEPSRLFRDLSESNNSAKLDLSVPFTQWSRRSALLKVGGSYEQAERTFNERFFVIRPSQSFDGDERAYFSEENMGIVDVTSTADGQARYVFGNTIADQSKARNNYTGRREIAAAYVMAELPLTRRLRAVGGGRLETTQITVESEDSSRDVGRLDNVDFLPSLNLVYELRENMNLRAAATRTLARPTFREIAPFESFEFILGDFFIGNPGLKRTLISNADLRWEWFTRPGELLAASIFYKELDNPIERSIVGGTNGQIKYVNVDKATVYGAEFELRSQLDYLVPTLENFSLGANLSLVYSNINIPEGELVARLEANPEAGTTRPLQGQSPYAFNADLSYDNPEWGTSASLFFNVFGERLANVSLGGTPDVFERPRPELDVSLSQRLPLGWQLKFSVKNLLDSAYKQTYEYRGQEYIYQSYRRGRTFSLGVKYNL